MMKYRAWIVAAALVVLAAGFSGWRAWSRRGVLKTRIAERLVYNGPAAGTGALIAVEDWPRWRGPRGDGISREAAPDAWPAGGPKRLWAADVGVGYSSPVAAGGKIYLFTLNNGKESLTAFDAATGRIAWSDESNTGWATDYAGTRSTPAIDGDAVYTYGGTGELICRDLATGKPRWRADVFKLAGTDNLQWGVGSTPLVAGGLVYVQCGQGSHIVAAVRKDTGQLAWASEAGGVGGYAHVILADVEGTPQLIVFAGDALLGMNPETGKTIWTLPWKTDYNVNAATPVYRDGHVFVTSAYGMGCMMAKVTPTGATKLWANKEVKSRFQPPVLDGGFLYANSEGTLKCLSWPDGAVKWKSERGEPPLGDHGSLVRAGDKLLTQSEDGTVALLRATPQGMTVLGEFAAAEGDKVWSTPLLYAGRLYVKGPAELVCFDLAPTPAAAPDTRPAQAAAR